MDEKTKRYWKIKSHVLRLYNRGLTFREIATETGFTQKKAAQFLQMAITDPVIVRGSAEVRKRLVIEKKVYLAINAFHGRNAGFTVDWM